VLIFVSVGDFWQAYRGVPVDILLQERLTKDVPVTPLPVAQSSDYNHQTASHVTWPRSQRKSSTRPSLDAYVGIRKSLCFVFGVLCPAKIKWRGSVGRSGRRPRSDVPNPADEAVPFSGFLVSSTSLSPPPLPLKLSTYGDAECWARKFNFLQPPHVTEPITFFFTCMYLRLGGLEKKTGVKTRRGDGRSEDNGNYQRG